MLIYGDLSKSATLYGILRLGHLNVDCSTPHRSYPTSALRVPIPSRTCKIVIVKSLGSASESSISEKPTWKSEFPRNVTRLGSSASYLILSAALTRLPLSTSSTQLS